MTKNLEELLNLEELSKAKKALEKINDIEIDEDLEESEANTQQIAEIEKHLSLLTKDGHDQDMDKIADECFDAFKHLMETGDNFADTRFSGKFYEAAVQMMKNVIDAKNSKVTAKLKKMELLLKAEKILGQKEENTESTEGNVIATRNEVLRAIKQDSNK